MSAGASPGRAGDALACAALGVAWLATIAFVGIGGEFPLNDDWAFARTAWNWAETGRLERVPWVYATSLPNLALAAGASAIWGASFEVLRGVNLALAWLAILGGYALCRQVGASPGVALLAAATLGWNPVALNLSFTGMSDVPFAALCTWTLVLGTRGLRRRSWPLLAGALALAVAATLTRQPGIALLGSLLLAISLRSFGVARTGVGLGLLLAGGLAWLAWEWTTGSFDPDDARTPFTLTRYVHDYLLSPHADYHATVSAIVTWVYLGWFLAPLAWLAPPAGPGGRRLEALALGLGALALPILLAGDRRLPFGLNIVHERGLGPLTLGGVDALPAAGAGLAAWWLAATAVASLGAAAVGVRILRGVWLHRHSMAEHADWLWLLLFPTAYLAALSVRAPFFDRYLTACLPPLLALLAWDTQGRSTVRLALGGLLAASFATYAVAGTRDYLEHHRARWALLQPLLDSGVAPERIDGGFEFGGLYIFWPAWRWVVDDEYRLSYAPAIAGYAPLAQRRYATLFPPGEETIVLHRRGADETFTP